MKLITTTAAAAFLLIGSAGLVQAQEQQAEQQQQQDQRMDESSVKQQLEQQGFEDIQNIDRLFVAEAKKDGETVNLLIDAQSGLVKNAETNRLTQASVEQLLQQEGYSEVSDLNLEGDTYNAKAQKDGQEASVQVDAATGEISQQD